jgi:hypothetical protein
VLICESGKSLVKRFAFLLTQAEVAQLVELQPSKLEVAGSRPVFRSKNAMFVMEHKHQVAETIFSFGVATFF